MARLCRQTSNAATVTPVRLTLVMIDLDFVVPSPSWPLELLPNMYRLPAESTAAEEESPALTETGVAAPGSRLTRLG